ncbi:MAG: hypothetical protein HY720_16715, partial [Planctomycetes bacterium]|nr:hypothetical protein [Planctomycetota bacterium]
GEGARGEGTLLEGVEAAAGRRRAWEAAAKVGVLQVGAEEVDPGVSIDLGPAKQGAAGRAGEEDESEKGAIPARAGVAAGRPEEEEKAEVPEHAWATPDLDGGGPRWRPKAAGLALRAVREGERERVTLSSPLPWRRRR